MIIKPCLIQYNFACDRAIIVPILNVHHQQFRISELAANIGLTVNLTTTSRYITSYLNYYFLKIHDLAVCAALFWILFTLGLSEFIRSVLIILNVEL